MTRLVSEMHYRQVGKTPLTVSEIGFGTGGTAGLMIVGEPPEQLDAVRRALELGINYFDEAPDYGDGLSESHLGFALKELGARPVITTKVEVRADNLKDIAGHIERSVEESLKRLKVEHVDIVQIHNSPVERSPRLEGRSYRSLALDDYLKPGGAIDGLDRVVKSGSAHFTGFICRGNDATEVRQLLDTGRFHLVNLVYTLLNPTAARIGQSARGAAPDFGGIIDYAQERGIGVAVYSPLAGGLLSDNGIQGGRTHRLSRPPTGSWAAPSKNTLERAKRFSFLASGSDRTLAQAAIRFILMHSGVTTVLGGFSDIAQLEEACSAADEPALSDLVMSQIEEIWRSY